MNLFRLCTAHGVRWLRALGIATLVIWGTAHAEAVPVHTYHALAMHGTPKYPPSFTHFEYVNPDAPKGGHVRQASIGSFDSFNPFIIKGTPADGIALIYDTLLEASADEPFTEYGLLAKSITLPEDRAWVEFELRPEARFHDGKQVTADDVIHTFQLLREQGRPFYRAYYADIERIEKKGKHRVRFVFRSNENKELPLIVGQVPILPKHYWQQRDFTAASLERPLGSGPYRIEAVDPGRSVTYVRNPDYWGADLPVNRGRYNFDRITFDYYRDSTVALEAFKAGELDFRQENNSKLWATAYDSPAQEQGLIKKLEIKHENPTGMQGFVFNTRRELFKDRRVREALSYVFDFEWTNKHLFYNAYTRTESYFSNSELAANGLPSAEELDILAPYREQLPEAVFTQAYRAPQTDGSGNNRRNLRKAVGLLRQAGWTVRDKKLVNLKTGQPFQFEMLLFDTGFERVVHPFRKNLERIGIQMDIRVVDASQYINRLRQFDFDMIVATFGQSNSPGNEQREYWHSEYAKRPDSRNLIGVRHPVIDELVELVISAPDRTALIHRTRALDRVLLWQHYVIPHWHTQSYRVAIWDKFGRPAVSPKYSLGFDTWWIAPDKARKLTPPTPAAS